MKKHCKRVVFLSKNDAQDEKDLFFMTQIRRVIHNQKELLS